MYIAKVPNRKSPPAILLRESYREGGKVKTRTLSNLTHLPKSTIELISRSLKGEEFVSVDNAFEKVESWHHGHVDAVLRAMKQLNFEQLINSRRCRERDLAVAMVVGRILEPETKHNSKLANTRWWQITTLPVMLDIERNVDENDLYEAMDWLLARQEVIEKKLARRHLQDDGLVLYDLTSSYFEGVTCPLAELGHNRDGKKGKLQVNYGLLTDERGCPVAVSVFSGNTLDYKTLMSQTEKVRDAFGIKSMVLVGDRGMITQKLINEELRNIDGVEWITAFKSGAIRKLVNNAHIQLGLFDERNLFEVTTPEYPGERLVVCRNPELASLRAHKRQSLLDATLKKLEEAQSVVDGGKLREKNKIAKRLENIVKKYKVAKHYKFTVHDDKFKVQFNKQNVCRAALQGALQELSNVQSLIKRGKLHGKSKIRKLVNKTLGKYNLAEHVSVDIQAKGFDFNVKNSADASEAAFKSVSQAIEEVRCLVKRGKYGGKDAIGMRIGKVIDKYKVAKHIVLSIRDNGFDFGINEENVAEEAALDGIYVIRTSLPVERMSAEDTVRSYKSLSCVERAFRSIKTVDLKVRPIRHRLEDRVRAHILLCMLAYYVEWHMREAWRPLIFADEDQEAKKISDPVTPAKRSDAALRKIASKQLDDATEAHSFQTLLTLMSQIVRNECRSPSAVPDSPTFEIVTTPNKKQQQAYDLLKTIKL